MTIGPLGVLFENSLGKGLFTQIAYEMVGMKSFTHRRNASSTDWFFALGTGNTDSLKVVCLAVRFSIQFEKFSVFERSAARLLADKTLRVPVATQSCRISRKDSFPT